ncbi:hypothetical protein EON76_04005 [bacterium]|nr:MAG: hypothetical protein EON76_04005 [bacterium]
MEHELTVEQRQRRINYNGLLAAIKRREVVDITHISPNDVPIEGIHTARIAIAIVQQGRSADGIGELKV